MSGPARIAISMGDPTGIGPEVTIKALRLARARREIAPILVGDVGVYVDTARRLGLPLRFVPWIPPHPLPSGGIAVREVSRLRGRERQPGRPTQAGGRAAHAAIVEAVNLVRADMAQALVTAPVCKANLVAAGVRTTGHTELLAALTRSSPVRMMMIGSRLRVMLVTTHLALARVPRAISARGVYETIQLGHTTLVDAFGMARPRLAVTGLNPHAGEGGLFGREDQRAIAPGVRRARRRGIDAVGPLPADTAFPQAAEGRFDLVVCMYHDQGLAPFKLLHFADGVNYTAGLPFVRTSPDHGTAHDIAGRGIADARSMAAAIAVATQGRRLRRAA